MAWPGIVLAQAPSLVSHCFADCAYILELRMRDRVKAVARANLLARE